MCIDKRINEIVELYEKTTNKRLTEKEKELIGFGFKQAVLDSAWEEHVNASKVNLLRFNDDGSTIFGNTIEFESKEEFFSTAMEYIRKEIEDYEEGSLAVTDVEIKPYIYSNIAFDGDNAYPITDEKLSISIENNYVLRLD